jgi:hypothetical protein
VISRATSQEIAALMRHAIGAESVLCGMEDGDVAGEHVRRLAAHAFELAEGGMLTAAALTPLARFASKHPRIANWIVILRRLLAAQAAS